jgi:hypothetical protein
MGYEELRRNLQWLRGEDGVVEPSDFDTLERNVADCELCRSEIVDALEAILVASFPLALSLDSECDVFPSFCCLLGLLLIFGPNV